MSFSTPVFVEQPSFEIVGLSVETTLRQMQEQQTVKRTEEAFLNRISEVEQRIGTETYLIEVYPVQGEGFNEDTPYTAIVGVQVKPGAPVPAGMIRHTVPASTCVKVTYRGPESELGETYGYLYGSFLEEAGRYPNGFNFERWDDRYKPGSPDNEVEIYIAVK